MFARGYQGFANLETALQVVYARFNGSWLPTDNNEEMNARELTNRGASYAALGLWERAIADYERALNLKPSPKAYHNRGNVYAKLGQHTQAIGDFKRALALDPRIAETHLNMGVSYAALGKLEQAFTALNQATTINP